MNCIFCDSPMHNLGYNPRKFTCYKCSNFSIEVINDFYKNYLLYLSDKKKTLYIDQLDINFNFKIQIFERGCLLLEVDYQILDLKEELNYFYNLLDKIELVNLLG